MVNVFRVSVCDSWFAPGAVLFYLLNVADSLTTWVGLTQQGGAERVALYAFLYGTFPLIAGVAVKLLVTTLVALYCCWQYSRWRVAGYALLVVANVVIAAPVTHNLTGLL